MVSVYKNTFSKDFSDGNEVTILEAIKSGHWASKIIALRDMTKEDYKSKKTLLPAVTFSGTFHERLANKINKYSGLIVLDIDGINELQIKGLKNDFRSDPLVYCAFTSPSGKGLKILIKVSTGADQHLSAFLHAQKIFEEKYCLKVDDSGKDVCRLCYVSFDPELYLNNDSAPLEVDVRYGEVNKYTPPANLQNYTPTKDAEKVYSLCVKWVERTMSYVEGSRNRFVHAVACALNRCGMDKDVAEVNLVSGYPDLTPEEVRGCVKSAYFHNMSEHGSVEVKDIGGEDFKAPAYVQNYTDDVVVNDIMEMTSMLHFYKVPNEESYRIIKKIGAYYQAKGFIDFKRKSLGKIMNEAIDLLSKKMVEDTDSLKLNYMNAENILEDIIGIDTISGTIPTTFKEFDVAMRGGLTPGNFYGLIGVGGTFKSILSEFFAVVGAQLDRPVLYLNGEMTKMQFYERLSMMTMQTNLFEKMQSGEINKETMPAFIKQMNGVLNNNLFFVNGNGFNQENVLATIDNIRASTGKKVAMVVVDGVTQMDDHKLQEIPAAIKNTAVCKEIAKNANSGEGVIVIGLMHVSGQSNKLMRDTGVVCRGGVKTLANMDGYFSTSLLASEENNSLEHQGDDIIYTEDKFHLRFTDKRGSAGVISAVIKVNHDLRLEVESYNTNQYEVKIERR
jgi:archaellum biogenesis ATPase FlaH